MIVPILKVLILYRKINSHTSLMNEVFKGYADTGDRINRFEQIYFIWVFLFRRD